MRFIAHRGNIFGPRPEYENKIDYMWHAYDVCRGLECDVQMYKDKLYFGHDEPQEEVDVSLMTMQNVFCHAKDLDAMMAMIGLIQVGENKDNLESVKAAAQKFKATFVMNQDRFDNYLSQL